MSSLFTNVGTRLKRFAESYFTITTILLVIGGIISFFLLVSEEMTAGFAWVILIGVPLTILSNLVFCWVLFSIGVHTEAVESSVSSLPKSSVPTPQPKKTSPKEKIPLQKMEYIFDEDEPNPLADDAEFIDMHCPQCGEQLSFVVGTKHGMCPSCGSKFDL